MYRTEIGIPQFLEAGEENMVLFHKFVVNIFKNSSANI